MVTFPPCKINLGLNVISKRADGYHNILTCFYPVPWTDVLEVVPAKEFSFSLSGVPVPGVAAENLCVRAYRILKEDHALEPVAMHLHKIIPLGAGLGGGSSDGSYALRTLNEIFNLSLSPENLKTYAGRLGSDCAFFIENKPAIGTGKGDILSDVALSLKGKYLVIVKPEIHISTAEAYSGITPANPAVDLRAVLENHPMTEWKQLLRNDFEAVLFKKFPIIETLKQNLYTSGATYAGMSGSGAAVFGIFENEVEIKNEFKNLSFWSGYLD